MTRQEIFDAYPEEEFLFADGYDDAILGVDEHLRIVYSVSKIIEILMREMEEDDAHEFFAFNIAGAYVGEKTPIYCNDKL